MSERTPSFARGYAGFEGVARTWTSASTPAWPEEARADGPNVIVIVVDDMGFSDTGPFGSEIDTPNLDRLAADGVRFSNYHSTPLCSPSRAAILTGINPHRAGFASVAHFDPGYPGYRMELADDVPTVAETLRDAGYATFAVGKWHLTKEVNLHDGGSKHAWPLQQGFDRYYGSMDAFTTMFHPHRIVVDNSPEERQWADDEYVTDTITDRAVDMVTTLRSSSDRPFFLYFAHQAQHGPIAAPAEDLAAVRGLYDEGWDVARERRIARQRETGLLPHDVPASETPREGPFAVAPWESLTPDQRELAARHMEVYAASLRALDRSVGRLLDLLDELGERDRTAIVFTSDNGATAEGGPDGTRSYFSHFQTVTGPDDDWDHDVDRPLDELGGPRVHSHYPSGWAHVSNAPFRRYKRSAFAGGIHCPLIVSWPEGMRGDARPRRQYVYATDLAPTLLEITGVERPATVRGIEAQPLDGTSFLSVLRDPEAPPTRTEQYVECGGELGYYHDGWKLVAPWRPGPFSFEEGWELYDVERDPAETRDVAAEHPEVVERMAVAWQRAAWENTVFPLDDDGSIMRTRPASDLILQQPLSIRPGGPILERYRASRLVVGREWTAETTLDVRAAVDGVIVAHGDQGGGYVLAIEHGALLVALNAYGTMHRATSEPLDPGTHAIALRCTVPRRLRWRFDVVVDGTTVASLDDVPQLLGMAPFTGISVGADRQGPVDAELRERLGIGELPGLGSVRFVPGRRVDDSVEYVDAERRRHDRSD